MNLRKFRIMEKVVIIMSSGLILLFLNFTGKSSAATCATYCYCYNVTALHLEMDCFGEDITFYVIMYLQHIQKIELRADRMKRMKNSTFKGVNQITQLSIAARNLQEIDKGVFENLVNLKELIFKHTMIRTIRKDLLSNLKSLTSFKLYDNNKLNTLKNINFSTLTKLIVLDIKRNKMLQLHEGMIRQLPMLRNLTIVETKSVFLVNITDTTFSNSKDLQSLIIESDEITSIDESSFNQLKQLQELSLSRCNIKHIDKGSFTNLTNLITLDLSHNKITFIDKSMFLSLQNLTILKLDHNRISQIHGDMFTKLKKLENLLLNSNNIQNIPSTTFSKLELLTRLNLMSNNITYINDDTFKNERCRYLNLRNNNIHILSKAVFSSMVNLKVLDLHNNQLTFIDKDLFKNLDNLTYLFLSKNKLSMFHEDTYKGLRNLMLLNLEDNIISLLPFGLFWDLHNLLFLRLSRNRLTQMDRIFNRSNTLLSLFLSDNELNSINEYTLKDLFKVSRIKMQNNRIQNIHHNAFNDIENLIELSMNQNNLTCTCYLAMLLNHHGKWRFNGNCISNGSRIDFNILSCETLKTHSFKYENEKIAHKSKRYESNERFDENSIISAWHRNDEREFILQFQFLVKEKQNNLSLEIAQKSGNITNITIVSCTITISVTNFKLSVALDEAEYDVANTRKGFWQTVQILRENDHAKIRISVVVNDKIVMSILSDKRNESGFIKFSVRHDFEEQNFRGLKLFSNKEFNSTSNAIILSKIMMIFFLFTVFNCW